MRKIKKRQYRAQILPLILIAFSFWMTITFGRIGSLRIIFLILTLAGLVGFFFTALKFRFRNRILMPDPESVYVPISGKVQSIKIYGDKNVIEIARRSIDRVEIRCPADDAILEAGEFILTKDQIRISFPTGRMIRVENAPMRTGEVIFLMIGKGSCRIELPKDLTLLLGEGKNCEAGESRIFTRRMTKEL